jgi:TolB-like protein
LRGWSTGGRWAAGLLVLLVCGLSLASNPSDAKGAEPKLLMLPFVVHSAEAPEYVRGGLSDMLSARFERIGGLELLREEDPEKGTSNLKTALATARKAGADYVLFGSFTRFGRGASLDVQCAPASSGSSREPLREIFVHSGSIGEIIPDLDELAGKVSRFARGENVLAAPAPAPVDPAPSASPSEAFDPDALADLTDRVGALEAAIVDLLEGEGETIEIDEP